MKRLRTLLAALAVLALIAAACADSSTDEAADEGGVDQVFFILDWVPKGQTSFGPSAT